MQEFGCSLNQSVEEIIKTVIEKIVEKIDSKELFYQENREKIIFAISVHSLECWILPIYESNKKEKIINCEDKLKYSISNSSSKKIKKLKTDKSYGNYDKLTQSFLKHKELIKIVSKNTSFQIFINSLPNQIE